MRQLVFIINRPVTEGWHLGMLRCAAHSVRLSNPDVTTTLLTDDTSADFESKPHHAGLFDRVIRVGPGPFDHEGPVARNRWIKTRIPDWVDGPFLYVDNDTVVLRSLGPLWRIKAPVALAPDCSQVASGHPKYDWLVRTFHECGWRFPTRHYLNGGVVFCSGSDPAKRAFAEWHRRWLQTRKRGFDLDQPALNSLWEEPEFAPLVLGREWNAMVETDERWIKGARIVHFACSHTVMREYVIDELAAAAARGEEIVDRMRELIRTRYIWKDGTHVRRHLRCGNWMTAVRIWLRKRGQGLRLSR